MARECGNVDLRPVLRELKEQRKAIQALGKLIIENGGGSGDTGYKPVVFPAAGAAAILSKIATVLGVVESIRTIVDSLSGQPVSNGTVPQNIKLLEEIKRDTAIIGGRTQRAEQTLEQMQQKIAVMEKKVNDTLFVVNRMRPEVGQIPPMAKKVNDSLYILNTVRSEIADTRKKANDAAYAATQASSKADKILSEISKLQNGLLDTIRKIFSDFLKSINNQELRQFILEQHNITRKVVEAESNNQQRYRNAQTKEINRWTTDQQLEITGRIDRGFNFLGKEITTRFGVLSQQIDKTTRLAVMEGISFFGKEINSRLGNLSQQISRETSVTSQKVDDLGRNIALALTALSGTVIGGFSTVLATFTALEAANKAAMAIQTKTILAAIATEGKVTLGAIATQTKTILAAIAASAGKDFLQQLLTDLINNLLNSLIEAINKNKVEIDLSGIIERLRIIGIDTAKTYNKVVTIEKSSEEAKKFSRKNYQILGGSRWGGVDQGTLITLQPEAFIKRAGQTLFAPNSTGRVTVENMIDLVGMFQVPEYFRTGLHRLPAKVPQTIHYKKGDKDKIKEIDINTLVDFQNWQFSQLDTALGAFPIEVKYKDDKGQEKRLVIENISEMQSEIMGLLLSLSSESDMQTELIFKAIAETIKGSNTAIYVSDHVQAISEFLGYRGTEVEREIPYQVTPNGKTLREIMTPSKGKIAGWNNVDKDDLMDHVKKLLFFGSIIHSVFYKTDGIPGDGIRNDLRNTEEKDDSPEKQQWDSFLNALRNPPTYLKDPTDPTIKVKDYSNGENIEG